GSVLYYATYTAFDGYSILPQLITTSDFEIFRIATLNGRAASNKGMAIFPRLVGGRYAALARSDGESNFLMMSDDVRRWDETQLIQVPRRTWDLLQIGNAGAPIETEAGWLVVTHGVGPMRQYALGAILLDIHDPGQVIGDLHEPLLFPDEQEREGYVPNVVYSCGSLVHNGQLVIPYGASDVSTNFATVALDDVLAELTLS
ncbi:MAG: glycosidase, partial [Acidimicrobiia bacterium]